MPKFLCHCGHVIGLSNGWSDSELALLPEQRIEVIGDMLASREPVSDEKFFELIDEVKTTVYHCQNCQRLHLERKSVESNQFVTYILESK